MMEDIQLAVGGVLYSSKADEEAFRHLLGVLDSNRDGEYDGEDPEVDIKIYGWSWGGITAVKLARTIKESKKFSICRKTVKVVAVIDPDTFGYATNSNVPDNVKAFYNWYQTNGTGGKPLNSHGEYLHIDDPGKTTSNFQIDYNVTGDRETFKYPKLVPAIISHHTLIWEVYSDVVASLR